jgi:hypothetical protein
LRCREVVLYGPKLEGEFGYVARAGLERVKNQNACGIGEGETEIGLELADFLLEEGRYHVVGLSCACTHIYMRMIAL